MMLFHPINRMAPLSELRREVESVLDRFSTGLDRGLWPYTRVFPALNVWEDGECFHVEAEIPGVSMKELDIYTSGNELTIKGQRKVLDGEDLMYHRQERGAGEFVRVLTLPADVNPDKVEATLNDGVLTIVLPKAEAAKMRKISVTTD